VSLLAPWALAGLLALPAIWWLHRRLRRLREVEVPSLLFLEPEAATPEAPQRRRIDAELLLALAAAALIALAAAGPVVVAGPAGKTVRVVVLSGTAGEARGFSTRVGATIADLRRAFGPTDRFVLVREPPSPLGPRPSEEALLDAARAGTAAARIVLSDRHPTGRTDGVRWVALGDPAARNVGIVAASIAPTAPGDGLELFANVANDSDGTATVEVALFDATRTAQTIEIPPRGLVPVRFPLASSPDALEVQVPAGDDLGADDHVTFTRAPLGVRIDPSVPAAHASALRRGLTAVLGEGGFREDASEPRLLVTTEADRTIGTALVLQPVPEDRAGSAAPPGADVVRADRLVEDLSTSGIDLVYARGAARPRADADLLLGRRAEEGVFAVVERRGRVVRLAPDPLRGSPAPAETPFWPLFLENLVGEVAGEVGPAGYRRQGLLDLATSRLGRDRSDFDPGWIAAATPDLPPPDRPLRPWLLGAALGCLALLWGRALLRRASSRTTESVAPSLASVT
jgi:hypothetical protein